MSDKQVTWQQGIAVVGGAFGLCCMGFMLLHGMVVTTRVEDAQNLKDVVQYQNMRTDRISDVVESFKSQNDKDHKEILFMLMAIKKELK